MQKPNVASVLKSDILSLYIQTYMYNNNRTKLYTWTYERFTFNITSYKEKAEYYLRMMTVTMAMDTHTVNIPKRIPIKQ